MANAAKKLIASERTVSYEDRAEIFNQLCSILEDWNINSVAETAGVHVTTIYHWLDGSVMLPRLDTIVKVANAIGYDLVLQESKSKPKLSVVK